MGARARLAPDLVERIRPIALAEEQTLPLLPALEPLLPAGLRRGTTVACRGVGSGATSLALALAAGPSGVGSWVTAVGLPSLGLVAAAELGVALDRIAMVAAPDGPSLPAVVATLVDAFDIVLLGGSHRLRPGDARRLTARVRERGAVLVPLLASGQSTPVGLEVDVRLTVSSSHWEGVGDGHGYLRARRVAVTAEGRRAAARTRQVELWLPNAGGEVALAGGVRDITAEAAGGEPDRVSHLSA